MTKLMYMLNRFAHCWCTLPIFPCTFLAMTILLNDYDPCACLLAAVCPWYKNHSRITNCFFLCQHHPWIWQGMGGADKVIVNVVFEYQFILPILFIACSSLPACLL